MERREGGEGGEEGGRREGGEGGEEGGRGGREGRVERREGGRGGWRGGREGRVERREGGEGGEEGGREGGRGGGGKCMFGNRDLAPFITSSSDEKEGVIPIISTFVQYQ